MNPNTPVTDDSSSLEEPINVGRLDGFTNVVQGSGPNSVMFTGDAPLRTTKKSYGFDSVHWLPHSLKKAALVIAAFLLFFGSAFGLIAFLSRPGPKQPTIVTTTAPAVSDTDRSLQNQGTLTINRELLVTNATTFEKTITVQGNTTVGQDLQVQGNGSIGGNLTVVGNTNLGGTVTAGSFIGNGFGLTGIQAGNCNDCTRQQGPLTSAQVGNIHIAGSIRAANFIGDGSQLSGIPTGCDTCVALQDNPFGPAQIGNASLSGRITAGSLFGDGSGLSNLNAANILAGVLNDARLSGNVVLLNAINNFTAATNSFAGSVGIATTSPLYPLDVVGDINSSTGLRVGGNLVCNSGGCISPGGSTAFVQGGNSFAATALLGTNDNNDLAIRTNGIERLRVDTSGNVGIGTTSPASKLHIHTAGGTNTSQFRVTSGTTGALSSLVYNANDVHLGFDSTYDGTFVARDTSTALLYKRAGRLDFTGDSGLAAGSSFTPTSRMSINLASGNVGIGTTTPGELLHVQKDQNAGTTLKVINATSATSAFAQVYVGQNLANSQGLYLRYNNTTNGATGSDTALVASDLNAIGGLILGTLGAAPLKFYTNNTPKMTILSGGNVGIGTTAPNVKLDVIGAINQSGSAAIAGYQKTNSGNLASTTSLNPGLLVFSDPVGASQYGMDLGYNGSYRTRIFTSSTTDIAFSRSASAGLPTVQSDFAELVTIKSSGNVGIGQILPGSKLSVSGNATIGAGYATTAAPTNGLLVQGNVGIGTSAPGNLLSIGALTTADGTGRIAVSTGGVNNKGIIIQAVAGQNVDLLQAQDSSGAVLASIDKVGNLTVKNATINGTLTVNGHIITANASGTTTIAAGAAACTTPTVSIAGNDTAGTITVTTGTGCAATGVLGTVTFANAYAVAPRVVISADNANATNLKYYTSGRTTTSFNLLTNNAPTDATTYTYNYQVLQ